MKKCVIPSAVTSLLTVAAITAGITDKSELATFLSPAKIVASIIGIVGTAWAAN